MKFFLMLPTSLLTFSMNTYAATTLNCTASVSEYISFQDSTSKWQTDQKQFSVQSKIDESTVVSSINLNGYEISAVLDEKEAFTPPALAARLTLVIVRKDANGVFKFHTNSSTALPLSGDASLKLVGWDFTGKHEKFDVGIVVVCK